MAAVGGGTTMQKLLDIGWTWGTARGECLWQTRGLVRGSEGMASG